MEFAPLSLPMSRRLETFAILQWLMTALFMAPLVIAIFCILAYNYASLAPIGLLYFAWYVYDYKSPESGGYNNTFVRRFKIWSHYRNYFPITLLKTHDLDSRYSYIIGYHPHGILGFGAWSSFGTDASDFAALFPNLTPRLITLQFFFKVPVVREYLMCCGILPCTHQSISAIIREKGKAAIIVLGGASEALVSRNNEDNLILKERKGFIKLALKNGAHLVPVFSFGENDLYTCIDIKNKWILKMQIKFKNFTSFSTPLFYGRGIFQYSFGLIPYRKPIHVIVGKAIPVVKIELPSVQQIDDLHEVYVKSLCELYEEHKSKYGIDQNQHINIL